MLNITSGSPKKITLLSFALFWCTTIASASPVKPNILISTRCGYGQVANSDGTSCVSCAPGSCQPLISTTATTCNSCSSVTYAHEKRARLCLACNLITTPGSNACDPISGQVSHCDSGWGLINTFKLVPTCMNCQKIPNSWSNGAARCLPCPSSCPTSCALGTGICVPSARKKTT